VDRLTLIQDEDGVHALLHAESSRATTGTCVMMKDIEAICEVTVNGRDIEDGLAPIQIVAAIIEKRLDLATEYVPMPRELPPWLQTPGDEWYFAVELKISGMEAGLAHLVMFGGEKEEVDLG
jgi:hypothetical protein